MTPLTATTSLARRIDHAECAVTVATAEALRASGLPGVRVLPVGGVSAVFVEPGAPFNKLIGLGLGDPVDEAALAEVERVHAALEQPLQVELATLADPAVGAMLTARGYVLMGFENVLGLRPAPDAAPGEGGSQGEITVDQVPGNRLRDWIETVTTGFLHEDTFDGPAAHESFDRAVLERVFDASAGVAGVRQFLASRQGVIAGGARLQIAGGIAMLAGAATLPEHRRRGVQAALLAARLADAGRSGCDLAVVTTQPGSRSHANVQRAGFQLLYSRAILRKDP